jgi:hypothetical protein
VGDVTVSKQSGLGARLLVGGYDISGDISAIDSVNGSKGDLDVTDVTQSAHSRIQGLMDGSMGFTSFWDVNNAHPVLSALPTADEIMAALLPPLSIGSAAACLNAKQIDYPPARASDAGLTMKVEGQGQGYGLDWGLQLTPGLRTDTAGTNGSSLDNGAATAFGAQSYLQVTAFTGTSVTVTVQHAPDNSTWSTLAAFTAVTAAPATQRLATFTGAFTATLASPAVFTAPGSALANGTPVVLSASGTPGDSIPGGFTAGTTYYVVSASGTSFELSATSGGSAVNSSSAGSGVVTQVVQRYLRVISAGTFSSATLGVVVNRNQAAWG